MNYFKKHLPAILSITSALVGLATFSILGVIVALLAVASIILAEWYARIVDREMQELKQHQSGQEYVTMFQVDCEKAENGEMSYAELTTKYAGLFPPTEEHQKLRAPEPRRSKDVNQDIQ